MKVKGSVELVSTRGLKHKFFHACVTQRRKKNWIKQIFDSQYKVTKEQVDIEEAFKRHHEDVFKSTTPANEKNEACLQFIAAWVTVEMKEILQQEFTITEVEAIVQQMGPLESLGLDGFRACFYQTYWSIVDDEVCNEVLNFLRGGAMEKSLNFNFIALIPKVKTPETRIEYIHISLCNIFYKIIAKTLANRLKKVLPAIISSHQNVFISRRLISDNIMVAYEALHSMKTRQ